MESLIGLKGSALRVLFERGFHKRFLDEERVEEAVLVSMFGDGANIRELLFDLRLYERGFMDVVKEISEKRIRLGLDPCSSHFFAQMLSEYFTVIAEHRNEEEFLEDMGFFARIVLSGKEEWKSLFFEMVDQAYLNWLVVALMFSDRATAVKLVGELERWVENHIDKTDAIIEILGHFPLGFAVARVVAKNVGRLNGLFKDVVEEVLRRAHMMEKQYAYAPRDAFDLSDDELILLALTVMNLTSRDIDPSQWGYDVFRAVRRVLRDIGYRVYKDRYSDNYYLNIEPEYVAERVAETLLYRGFFSTDPIPFFNFTFDDLGKRRIKGRGYDFTLRDVVLRLLRRSGYNIINVLETISKEKADAFFWVYDLMNSKEVWVRGMTLKFNGRWLTEATYTASVEESVGDTKVFVKYTVKKMLDSFASFSHEKFIEDVERKAERALNVIVVEVDRRIEEWRRRGFFVQEIDFSVEEEEQNSTVYLKDARANVAYYVSGKRIDLSVTKSWTVKDTIEALFQRLDETFNVDVEIHPSKILFESASNRFSYMKLGESYLLISSSLTSSIEPKESVWNIALPVAVLKSVKRFVRRFRRYGIKFRADTCYDDYCAYRLYFGDKIGLLLDEIFGISESSLNDPKEEKSVGEVLLGTILSAKWSEESFEDLLKRGFPATAVVYLLANIEKVGEDLIEKAVDLLVEHYGRVVNILKEKHMFYYHFDAVFPRVRVRDEEITYFIELLRNKDIYKALTIALLLNLDEPRFLREIFGFELPSGRVFDFTENTLGYAGEEAIFAFDFEKQILVIKNRMNEEKIVSVKWRDEKEFVDVLRHINEIASSVEKKKEVVVEK